MPEHSLLIFAETASASFLNSWGSRKASGENRLRITYVAVRHLLADISAVVFAFGRLHVSEDSSDGNRPLITKTGATRLPVLRKNPSACQPRNANLCLRIRRSENLHQLVAS